MLTLIAALSLAASSEGPAVSLAAPPRVAPVPIAALPALAATPVAPADDGEWRFSYTFVELGTAFADPDFDDPTFDDEVDTYYGKASLALFKFLYVFAGYENQNFDFEDTDADLFRLGVGGYVNVAPKLDLQADIAWLYADVVSDLDDLDDTSSGYEARGGARWLAFGWDGGGVELNGGLMLRGLENQIASDDDLFGWDAGLRVHFLRLFSLGASYSMLEDDDAVLVNARASF